MKRWLSVGWLALALMGCTDTPKDAVMKASEKKKSEPQQARPAIPASNWQRGQGQPYEVLGSQVWDVPDPVSGRDYQVFVALPASYKEYPERRYPVLYVTDADYAFPIVRQIARRLNGEGPSLEEFILVGLSYAKGESGMQSRRRDYTPTPTGSKDAPADAVHGQASAYITYLHAQVLPFVAQRYRTDETKRVLLGHSYGALLGTQVLLSDPSMFSGYILGSPSYWYDNHYMDGQAAAFVASHQDLPAQVYMYVGEYESIKPEDPRYAKRYDMVADARRMERVLTSKNYSSLHLKLEVLNDEDHLSIAPRGFTHGLKYLLPTKQ